jgi:Predicted Zn-dependent hydrolases of the beta-lactamase fold
MAIQKVNKRRRNMKPVYLMAILMFVSGLGFAAAQAETADLVKSVSHSCRHFYQSTVLIQGEKTVYFDPVRVPNKSIKADLVLVTHTHGDHFSIPDIQKVMKSDATLIIPADGAILAKEAGIKNVISIMPNQEYTVAGLKVQTVPAYNINKTFHPRQNNWVGYIVHLNHISYYMAGDTDLVPEMKEIKADVVFLPVGGTYTMTAKEAAEAANLIKPAIAVPIHFGDIVGSLQDAKDFVALLDKDIHGMILKEE